MASKKLYEAVASNLKAIGLAPADLAVVGAVLSEVFKADNPKFDEDRFREACRPDGTLLAVDADTLTRLAADYIVAGFEAAAKDPAVNRPSLDAIMEIARDSVVKRLSEEGGP